MKPALLLAALIFVTLRLNSSDCEGPIPFQPQAFDINGDGFVDVRYLQEISVWSDPHQTKNTIRYLTTTTRFLFSRENQSYFQQGQVIPPTNRTELVGGISLTEHLTVFDRGFPECILPADQRYWNSLTNGIAAIRFVKAGGVLHYGWIRLARPDTETSTPFVVVDYDWNPLPGEPIKAGLPPEIPLKARMLPDGLRLTWPSDVANWKLEQSDTLEQTAVWQLVSGADGPEVLLPIPSKSQFFRIRKP